MAEGEGVFIPTEGISPDMVNNPAMQAFIKEGKMDVSSVIKSYLGAQDLIGRKGIPAPKDANDAEGYARVFDALGRPKTADEYAIPKLEELKDLKVPEGFPAMPEERLKAFKEVAHKLGILPNQVQGLFRWYVENGINEYNQYQEDYKKSRDVSETSLRAKYGKAYETKVALGDKVIKTFSDKEGKFINFLKSEELHIHPLMVEFLSNIGEKLGEDNLISGVTTLTKTPQEAQAEINKIRGDAKHPYHIKENPEHKAAVEYMETLYAMANPEKPKE